MIPKRSASHGEAGYERRTLDAYFTEPWVTRILIENIDFNLPVYETPDYKLIWEPACGDGRMAEVLSDAGYRVMASDLSTEWNYGTMDWDFLADTPKNYCIPMPAAIITNPPFGDLASKFILRALDLTKEVRGKVAMLLRHEFDAPISHHNLFKWPFAAKLVLPKRPKWSDEPMVASPRFPYAWYLWDWRHEGEPVLRYLSK